jgi:hypothetical protein
MKAFAYIAVLGVAATAYLMHVRETVVYRGDGWCLSHDRDDVTLATDNPAANRPAPFFQIPSDVPTSSVLDGPDATGWTVRYTKKRRGVFSRNQDESCGTPDPGSGLVRFSPRTRGDISRQYDCPRLSYAELLLPKASDPLSTHVQITCSVETRVPNCRMVYIMPNGWQAEISLPKPHVARWRDASADARAFFDAKLTDCSTDG